MAKDGDIPSTVSSARQLADDELHQMLERHYRTHEGLGRCLVAMGWPDERVALAALAETLGIHFIDLSEVKVDQALSNRIPPELVQRKRVIPVAEEDGRLLLVMQDPLDFQTVDHIRILTQKEIDRAICTEADMESAMQTFYGFSVDRMIKHLETPADVEDKGDDEIGHLREIASEASVVNLVDLVVARAIRDGASDIHIEPFERQLKIKYRIDGILHDMPSPPKHLQAAIISRVKIMAEMNIAERYVPQDGHIELRHDGREIDVRVATIPTLFGECVVMRLLDKSMGLRGLEELGFEPETLGAYSRLLSYLHGIVLVCGPTGCGKTTTLYASLGAIYTTERKFITIEDPVECQLIGVNQIPVRPKRGLTFANGLRSILRQDPDVIMVGEIRDRDTADIAIRSALTGHLVLSSLHTNDAAESITRLQDMGVEPYLIASAVRGVLAQRLVRRVCPACRERVEPSEAQVEQIRRELGPDQKMVLYQGRGCSECKGTGYRGRTGILELLVVDENLRDYTLKRAPAAVIRQYVGNRMLTMRRAGWLKVARGITTPEEVLRAVQADELVDQAIGGT